MYIIFLCVHPLYLSFERFVKRLHHTVKLNDRTCKFDVADFLCDAIRRFIRTAVLPMGVGCWVASACYQHRDHTHAHAHAHAHHCFNMN